MFSHNDCISEHQVVRLLVMDLFTGACLFLPMALSKISGNGGLVAFFVGIGLTLLYGWLLSKSLIYTSTEHWLKRGTGFGISLCRLICGLRCFGSYIFLFGLFTSVLHETFLYTMNRSWLVFAMLIVLIYGGTKGLEMRARLAELFFYCVLIPIFFIGIFSLPEADWTRLMTNVDSSFSDIAKGALVTWILMEPVEWVVYLQVTERSVKRDSIVRKAILVGGVLVGLMYSLCVGVLDVSGMVNERWPTVILMQILKIPGGFVSRQDGLMLSLWIFAMYISLSGAVSHASELLFIKHGRHRSKYVIVCAVAGAGISLVTKMKQTFLDVYFYGMILTGILWTFVLSWRLWRDKIKRKTMRYLTVFVVAVLGLSGCSNYVELENREFVMAMGVDAGENAVYRFTFTFPDLSGVTGEGEAKKVPPVILEADTLKMAEERYNQMSEDRLDYGQLKVIMFGQTMEAKQMERLFNEIKQMTEIARTVLLCRSDVSAELILGKDESLDAPVGMFLEQLFENHEMEMILNDWMDAKDVDKLPKVSMFGEYIGLVLP